MKEKLGTNDLQDDAVAGLAVIGTEYYQATHSDEGIIRVFLRNNGPSLADIESCQLQAVHPSSDLEQNKQNIPAIKCLYFRLDPEDLLQGQVGELLVRPDRRPSLGALLRCSLLSSDGQQITADVLVRHAPLRISYVAFSEDLSSIYIYIRSNLDQTIRVILDQVNEYTTSNSDRTISSEILPASDTCLVFAPPFPLEHGQYVHVHISGTSDNSALGANAVIRVFGGFPLSNTRGGGDTELGLSPITIRSQDYTGPVCVYGMECISHDRGTPTEAASQFKALRRSIIAKTPETFVYILFCWPQGLRLLEPFFQLSDLPVVNTCRNSYRKKTSTPQTYRDSYHPYLWRARQASALSSPRPFIAVVPVGPNAKKNGFHDDFPSTDRIRFMAYSAIAGGAKGIFYMFGYIEDSVRRREFVRLNKELNLLSSLLVISQPLTEAKSNNENIYAGVLQCGHQTLLTILLNKAHPGSPSAAASLEQASASFMLEIPIPLGSSVREVQDLYKPIPSSHWSLADGILKVDHTMIDSAETLRIDLDRISEQHCVSEPTSDFLPCSAKD